MVQSATTAEIVDWLLLITGGLDLHTQCATALTLYTLDLQNDKNKKSVGQWLNQLTLTRSI